MNEGITYSTNECLIVISSNEWTIKNINPMLNCIHSTRNIHPLLNHIQHARAWPAPPSFSTNHLPDNFSLPFRPICWQAQSKWLWVHRVGEDKTGFRSDEGLTWIIYKPYRMVQFTVYSWVVCHNRCSAVTLWWMNVATVSESCTLVNFQEPYNELQLIILSLCRSGLSSRIR